ncbi:MAG: glycosyltransferase family 4 protein [bacterium]
MKILLINKFLYPKGGDAVTTLNTGELLTKQGHEVTFWGMQHPLNPSYPYKDLFVSHVDFHNKNGIYQQLKTSFNILYSFEAKNKIEKLIKIKKPDIIHLHNFAHQISPSILNVFKKYSIPSVMTMHDYKLVCPSYTMLLNGIPCEKCKKGNFYFCLVNKCTKNSCLKSLISTIELYLHHKILNIYGLVNTYISPSKFLKSKCEEMGLKQKIEYLPNFVNAEEYKPSYNWSEGSILFFGRLSEEKGLFTLVEAIKGLDIKLKIIGEGLIKETLEKRVKNKGIDNVQFLGYKTGEELKNEIRNSMFVVLPSEWYENNPRSVIEAFALGKPTIGAKIGGIPELVRDNQTGLTFEPGDSNDLRSKIECLFNSPEKIVAMGKNARAFVEKELTAEKHYTKLIEIYKQAMCKYYKPTC